MFCSLLARVDPQNRCVGTGCPYPQNFCKILCGNRAFWCIFWAVVKVCECVSSISNQLGSETRFSVVTPVLVRLFLDDLGKLCSPVDGCYILLYADDILLISPSVSYLEKLLHRCERKRTWLDMPINLKKSNYLHVGLGPRRDVACAAITCLSAWSQTAVGI